MPRELMTLDDGQLAALLGSQHVKPALLAAEFGPRLKRPQWRPVVGSDTNIYLGDVVEGEHFAGGAACVLRLLYLTRDGNTLEGARLVGGADNAARDLDAPGNRAVRGHLRVRSDTGVLPVIAVSGGIGVIDSQATVDGVQHVFYTCSTANLSEGQIEFSFANVAGAVVTDVEVATEDGYPPFDEMARKRITYVA